MIFKNFSEFTSWAKNYAKEIHTMVDSHDYVEYGWGNVTFMTDKFGGTYCSFHYDYNTNEIVDWYGTSNEKKMNSLHDLKNEIIKLKSDLESKRNLDEIYVLVNSEY